MRAPKDGLPAVDGADKIPPYALLWLLKGAYGLTEAPRLWYLRARQILSEIGFVELRCARAVFVLRDETERLVAMLTLHVDDGMLFGNGKSPVFEKARKMIDKRFNIKKWAALNEEKAEDYLGMQWIQGKGFIMAHMDAYIEGLEPMDSKKGVPEETPLNELEKTEFKSTHAKLRWPVSHVVPELAYGLSALAQKSRDDLTAGDVTKLNALIKKVKEITANGGGRLTFRALDLNDLVVATPFDASFAKEADMKSQCGFMSFLTTSAVMTEPTQCSLVEFQSSTISRRVKSTMAAESAALSTAVDRHLYLRLLVESILYGEPEYGTNWRTQLKIPGVCITDAKSLYDHLSKTGSIPTERQVLIDLLTARDLIETKVMALKWVPTKHMPADILTKLMALNSVQEKVLRERIWSTRPTEEEDEEEKHRQELRQGQRQRRKIREKEARAQQAK